MNTAMLMHIIDSKRRFLVPQHEICYPCERFLALPRATPFLKTGGCDLTESTLYKDIISKGVHA